MADTYLIHQEITPIACLEQLAPNPSLLDEASITTAALIPTLGGFPSNQPYVVAGSPFALFNAPGSGKRVNVIDFAIDEVQSRTGTGTAFAFGVQRVTAIDGGDDVAAIPLDSTSSSLPSQVLIRELPSSLTTTGETLRKVRDLPQLNLTRAVPFPPWRQPGTADRVYGASNSDVQGQVLREGEGIAIMTTASSTMGENWPLAISVVISVGGATYWIRNRVVLGAWPAMMAIFNGSGSGVVVTVLQVNVSELMTDETTIPRRFQLETISGLLPNSALNAIEVDKMDSTSPNLPSTIIASGYAGCLQISSDGCCRPGRANENLLRRLVSTPFGTGPGLASGILLGQACAKPFTQTSSQPFVLREGEGIALFQRQTYAGWAWGYFVRCMFTVEDAAGLSPAIPVLGGSIVRAA